MGGTGALSSEGARRNRAEPAKGGDAAALKVPVVALRSPQLFHARTARPITNAAGHPLPPPPPARPAPGYITLTAPRAMFWAQLIGGIFGCIVGPFAFMLFYKTGQVGG